MLICDDDAGYRALVRTLLLQGDIDVDAILEAADGEECVEKASRERVDLVLLDLNMPGLDGYDAIPRLRTTVPDACILVLSSASREFAEPRLLALGAHGFIQKPMDIFCIVPSIRVHLDLKAWESPQSRYGP